MGKINKKVDFPSILTNLRGKYDWINCEFVDGNLIEVHIRQNPDFRYNNDIAIPIWEDDNGKKCSELSYIKDSDYKRKGFFIK